MRILGGLFLTLALAGGAVASPSKVPLSTQQMKAKINKKMTQNGHFVPSWTKVELAATANPKVFEFTFERPAGDATGIPRKATGLINSDTHGIKIHSESGYGE
jgi:hypothetical protein